MSAKQNARTFEHVQKRCLERYKISITRETWGAWNHALRESARREGLVDKSPQTVREVEFEGQKIIVLCSNRLVLTAIDRRHAMKIYRQSVRRAS